MGNRLVVVGTGIRTVGQLTTEAMAWLRTADLVLHLVADPVAAELIRSWRPGRERSLRRHYVDDRPRRAAYEAMAAEIVDELGAHETVCAAFYGHPGVFARAPRLAVARARAEGHEARMVPGISAEDCLFADLGVDPGDGCLSFEATNFVQFDHRPDPTAHLVLWQVGAIGQWHHRAAGYDGRNVGVLVEKLAGWYPTWHEVVVYEAARLPWDPPRAERVALELLPDARLTNASTLYVPPSRPRRPDPAFADLLA